MHASRLSVWSDIERCTFARTLVKFGILAAAKNIYDDKHDEEVLKTCFL